MWSKAFCGPTGRCLKPDKLPKVMSLESASVRAGDYKFENGETSLPDLCSPLLIVAQASWLEARLDATNVVKRSEQTAGFCHGTGREMFRIKSRYLWFYCIIFYPFF